jgi:hypothetical protein
MNGASAPLVTAVRGPIVLITFGALFAVDHAGGFRFSQTWPILFIVFGVMKLLERSLAPKPEFADWTPPPQPPAPLHGPYMRPPTAQPPTGPPQGEN